MLNSTRLSIHPALARSLVLSVRPTIVAAAVSSLEGLAEGEWNEAADVPGLEDGLVRGGGGGGGDASDRPRTVRAEEQPSHSHACPNRTARWRRRWRRRPALSPSLSPGAAVRWPSSFSSRPLGAVVPAFLSSLLFFLPFLPPICERGRGGLLYVRASVSEGGRQGRRERGREGEGGGKRVSV